MIDDCIDHPHAVVHYDFGFWHKHCMTTDIISAYHAVHHIKILEEHRHKEHIKVQAVLVKHMLKHSSLADSQVALRRRLSKWWSPEDAMSAAPNVIQLMQCHKKLPGFIKASYLRTLTNSWTTGARFGMRSPCPYGCRDAEGSSSLEHLLACPLFQAAAQPYFTNWHGWPLSGNIVLALGLHIDPASPQAAVTLIWHDVAYDVFCAFKHGGARHVGNSIRARIRAINRMSPHSRSLLLSTLHGAL